MKWKEVQRTLFWCWTYSFQTWKQKFFIEIKKNKNDTKYFTLLQLKIFINDLLMWKRAIWTSENNKIKGELKDQQALQLG